MFMVFREAVNHGILPLLLKLLQTKDISTDLLCEVAWVLTYLTHRYLCYHSVRLLLPNILMSWSSWSQLSFYGIKDTNVTHCWWIESYASTDPPWALLASKHSLVYKGICILSLNTFKYFFIRKKIIANWLLTLSRMHQHLNTVSYSPL